MVRRREGGRSRAAAQPLDPRPHLVAITADHRQVEHGDLDLARLAPGGRAVSPQHRDLGVEGVVRGQVAPVGLAGRDRQRAALTAAADDDRHVRHRAGVAGRLRQADPLPDVSLRARRPQRADRLDRRLEPVQPLGDRRERQPEREVFALPPPGPQAEEGPPAADGVERRGQLRRDPGGPERHRGHERAQPQVGVEPGQQPERHPRLRDRLPGPVDLRDLDQVIHQRQPGAAGLVRG